MVIVVKIGTSSLTDDTGNVQGRAITKLCDEVAAMRALGHDVVVVTSGAISVGVPVLGMTTRPRDLASLQAAAAVGQGRLMRLYDDALGAHHLVAGQLLVAPANFFDRTGYLHVRTVLQRLLQMGAVPVVNENDAATDEEIRFGDNDRIAALVAHAVHADLLVLLTDTAGLFTADPRVDEQASLVEEVTEGGHELDVVVGGSGTDRGSGGMASKLQAARMASWSGVRCVIAAADRSGVLAAAAHGEVGVGTIVHARANRLPARKLWIAFAMPTEGRAVVDDGARRALVEDGRSLLPAGVVEVEGTFVAESGVEIVDRSGVVLAKGVSRYTAEQLRERRGSRTADLPDELSRVVVHRDDLVVF